MEKLLGSLFAVATILFIGEMFAEAQVQKVVLRDAFVVEGENPVTIRAVKTPVSVWSKVYYITNTTRRSLRVRLEIASDPPAQTQVCWIWWTNPECMWLTRNFWDFDLPADTLEKGLGVRIIPFGVVDLKVRMTFSLLLRGDEGTERKRMIPIVSLFP